jgi:hypothetical protein
MKDVFFKLTLVAASETNRCYLWHFRLPVAYRYSSRLGYLERGLDRMHVGYKELLY